MAHMVTLYKYAVLEHVFHSCHTIIMPDTAIVTVKKCMIEDVFLTLLFIFSKIICIG